MPDQLADSRNQNAVRAVLRNEITWIIFIIGLLWGAVQGIILPIQALQLGQAQIQQQLQSEKKTYDNMQMQMSALETQQSITETKLEQHLQQTK